MSVRNGMPAAELPEDSQPFGLFQLSFEPDQLCGQVIQRDRQIAQFDQRYTDEIEPHLGNVRAPMLILWGEQDQWLPIAHGHKLASLIPGARLRTIPGSGHLVHEDAPEAIVAALLTPAD